MIIVLLQLPCWQQSVLAQTRLAVPSAQIDFTGIDKKAEKVRLKRLKLKDKIKTKKIKNLGKFIDENTDL